MELKNLKCGIRIEAKTRKNFAWQDSTNEKKRWEKIYEYDWCKS
jgi:hypothetical protein